MIDPRARFTDAAAAYARYRPGYPAEIVQLCKEYAGLKAGATVVDVGCGTGISSRLFAGRGLTVVGIEPNAAMRQAAVAAGGDIDYRPGEAAATGLADASADLIVAAQALHWFDMPPTMREWRRVLKPGGACAAFWNYRSDAGWQVEYEALLSRFSSDYAAVSKATGRGDDNSRWVRESAECQDLLEHHLSNAQSLDWQGLHGRAWSSSYVIHGNVDRAAFDAELRALFEAHARDGRIAFEYRVYLLLWRFSAQAAAHGPRRRS